MTGTIAVASQRFADIVPAASHQVDQALVLDSSTAGVVVLKSGQLRSAYRNEGRIFARELAKHVNGRQDGKATALVYEETFGYEDRLHWLIHLQGLQTYYDMVEMGDEDRAYRESVAAQRVAGDEEPGGAWDRLFLDGSMRSDVLLPLDGPAAVPAPLNSATAGIVVHRVAQPGYGMRAEALDVARELTAALNADSGQEVGAVCFEEAFGPTGRLHWLIHLRDLTVWEELRRGPACRSEGRPGVFADAGREEIALTPHHWGLYATRSATG